MRTFTFDGRAAKEPAAVASKTVAGRNAPASSAPAPAFNPFGFMKSGGAAAGTAKENQVILR